MKAADAVDWNNEDERASVINMWQAMLSAAPAPEGGAVRYRHKKRGTEYTLIGVGRAQGELQDEDPVVLYRGDDGGLWVRHQVEFCDGRFEQVSALATREEAPAEAAPACSEIPLSNHMRVTLEYDPDGSRTATLWNEANEPIADGEAPALTPQLQARSGDGK